MAINLTDFDKIWASSSPLTPYSFSDANYEEGWNFIGSTPPARQMWDGYMKWSDEKQQYIVQNFLPLSGGTMTNDISTSYQYFSIKSTYTNNAGGLTLRGGTNYADGSSLTVYGKNHSSLAGQFNIIANDGTNSATLNGRPNGTLTWDGKSIPQRAFGVQLESASPNNTYTFSVTLNGAVVFAKRGANCGVYMVDFWTADAVKIGGGGNDPVTVTKSANSANVTVTNINGNAVVVKILNGDTL